MFREELLELDEVLKAEQSHPEYLEVIVEFEGGMKPNAAMELCQERDVEYHRVGQFGACEMMRVEP